MIETRARKAGGAAAIALAILMTAASSGPAAAQRPGVQIQSPSSPFQQNIPRSWHRNYDYGVEVDGHHLSDVGLYQVVGKSSYMLVYGPELDTAWVLSTRPKEVRPVPKASVTVKDETEVVLAESAFLGVSPSPWATDGATAVVFYGGRSRIRVARVPALVGETTVDDIYETNPMYRRGAESYNPDQAAIAKLKKVSSPFTIEVWFGSWCPHCQRVVPRFIKVMEAASNPNVDVLYHGVPRDFGTYEPAVKKDVSGLPTFIVMKDGREFSRFKGAGEKESLEAELATLLTPATQPTGR